MIALHVRCRRRAFTLLEVVLALALSAVVVYLIAGALDFHLRQLTVRRTSIEEAQLARAILRRIGDDLRAVVVDRPIDFSSAGQLAQATAAGSLSSDGSAAAGGTTGGSTTGGSTTGGATSGSSTTGGQLTSGVISPMPGIYGNEFELQVDISRVPRYEEYAVLDPVDNLQGMRLLSDVKTVSYFLLGQNGIASSGLAGGFNATDPLMSNYNMLGLPPGQPLRGLARRIVDRAATRYAMNTADYSFTDQQTELIAPEVMFVQFRYFDGLQWLPAWDSQQFGGVPVAIEIILGLETSKDPAETESPLTGLSYDQLMTTLDPNHVYRLVVHLPSAEPTDTTAASSTTSTSTSTSTSTQQGTTP